MHTLTLILSLALAATPADILLPGHKPVDHRLVLQPGPATAGWVFVAAPTAGFGVEVVSVGEPFAFSSKYGTRLHAFRQGTPIPRSWDAFADTGTALPNEIASVPVMSPLARVVTTLRVVAVDDGRVTLEVVDEQRFDAGGSPLHTGPGATVLLAGLSALGLLGLAWIARHRAAGETRR